MQTITTTKEFIEQFDSDEDENDCTMVQQKILNIEKSIQEIQEPIISQLKIKGLLQTTKVMPWRLDAIMKKQDSTLFQNQFKLGEGSYGKVLKCFDAKQECDIALKLVVLDQFNNYNELIINSSLSSSYIIKVMWPSYIYELEKRDLINNEVKLTKYLLIPFELGQTSLRSYLNYLKHQELIPTQQEFLNIFNQLIFGLIDIHRSKIAHRDIKPDNIIFRQPEQKWKYTDFGVSKYYEVSKKKWSIEGTLLYMQPYIEEEYRNQQKDIIQDLFQNDLYALALTLYEIQNPLIEKKVIKQNFESNRSQFFSDLLNIKNIEDLEVFAASFVTFEQFTSDILLNFLNQIKQTKISEEVDQNDVALAYEEFGQYEKAREIYEDQEIKMIKSFGITNPKVQLIKERLLRIYQKQEKWQLCKQQCDELLLMQKELGNNFTLNLAELQLSKGLISYKLGDIEQAQKTILEVFKLFNNQRMTTKVQELQSLLYRAAKQYDLSLEYCKKVYESKIQLYGSKDIKVSQTLGNMALVYLLKDDFVKAEDLFEQVRQDYINYYGENSLEVIRITRELILSKIELKKYKEAKQMLINQISFLQLKNNAELFLHQEILGKLYLNLEEYYLAQQQFENIIEAKQKEGGISTVEILKPLQLLGQTLEKCEEFEKAKIIYEKTIVLMRKNNINSPIDFARVFMQYASVLEKLNQPQKAKAIYIKVEEKLKSVQNQESEFQLYLNCLQNLSIINKHLKNYEEAQAQQQKVIQLMNQKCPNHPHRKTFEFNHDQLVKIFEQFNDPKYQEKQNSHVAIGY